MSNGIGSPIGCAIGWPIGALTNSSSPAFTPSSLGSSLLAWYDATDASTITIATGVSQWSDKSGNNRHVSQGTTTNQPSWNGVDTITYDGTDDYLTRSGAFMWDNGTCELHAVMKSNGGAAKGLVGEGRSSTTNPVYWAITSQVVNSDDFLYSFLRNDAASNLLINTLSLGSTVFDDVKKLVSWIDSGVEITSLVNGVEGSTPRAYTRTGTLTLDTFTIGGLVRTTASGFLAVSVNEICITSLLDDAQRNDLMQYLGAKHGL